MKEKINLNISYQKINKDNVSTDYIPTGITTDNNIRYYELNEFSKMFGKSTSQLRRLIKKIGNIDCHKYYCRLSGKYFLSESVLRLSKKSYSKKEDLRGDYKNYLSQYRWDFFGCIAFESQLTMGTARNRIEKYFEVLVTKMSGTGFRLFFTCEPNETRRGYHVHFILGTTDQTLLARINNTTVSHFRKKHKLTNLKFEKFDKNKDGIQYILKHIKQNEDGYDFLVHNAN